MGFGVLVTFASSSTATTYIDLGWVTALVENDRGWQRALRESWRQKCFNRFRAQDRIDASACRNVPCKASRLKAIQGMTLTSHEYGVLTGATGGGVSRPRTLSSLPGAAAPRRAGCRSRRPLEWRLLGARARPCASPSLQGTRSPASSDVRLGAQMVGHAVNRRATSKHGRCPAA